MSKITVKSNGDGMAQEVNPYPQNLFLSRDRSEPHPNSAYQQFNKSHPPLPLIDNSGNIVIEAGEFEVEKIWQQSAKTQRGLPVWITIPSKFRQRFASFEDFNSKISDRETREAYQILPVTKDNTQLIDTNGDNITEKGRYIKDINGKQHFFLDSEIAEIIEKINAKIDTNEPDNKDNQRAETVEEAAERYYNTINWSDEIKKETSLQQVLNSMFIAGANYQASQPDNISRAVEIIAEKINFYDLQMSEEASDIVLVLTDILNRIKQI